MLNVNDKTGRIKIRAVVLLKEGLVKLELSYLACLLSEVRAVTLTYVDCKRTTKQVEGRISK